MPNFAIVGKRFSPPELAGYLDGLKLDRWRPSMVVLHNTAVPALKDRPKGFSEGSMGDLRHYYGTVQGWSGGPHLFVDQNGIWVFNPLDRPGVHSPSWNSKAWGVEMLGDYETESFDAGPGGLVRDNAVHALAAMFSRLDVQPIGEAFKVHREDPRTTHQGCPGRRVDKETVRHEVLATMANQPKSDGMPIRVVVYRKGQGQAPAAVLAARLVGGVTLVDAQALGEACGISTPYVGERPLRLVVGDRYGVTPRIDQAKVYLVEG